MRYIRQSVYLPVRIKLKYRSAFQLDSITSFCAGFSDRTCSVSGNVIFCLLRHHLQSGASFGILQISERISSTTGATCCTGEELQCDEGTYDIGVTTAMEYNKALLDYNVAEANVIKARYILMYNGEVIKVLRGEK
ncbi:hypothetical protein [Sphingobacterium faecale]|uniref:Uncharacterized protein n=1 Tax=Sphingobacterium faecale TaxID=2803775 RepID=A0ABS1R046_9SPHI|nr:hypothetical protein [Sphingobacterium faecale]MBL1408062.1 hypothetical protein [Sphingobacterium faecale]